jgi:TniQ
MRGYLAGDNLLVKYIDLHARGEPPFPSWEDPRQDEPAHGYFIRLTGLNGQLSASAVARSFGLSGNVFRPSEYLDFVLSFPIKNKERLLSATPIVNKTSVAIFGEIFRRRDWSTVKRHFCPGCLAEDAYHRSFWDLVAFRHCPFHDQPLCCIDRTGNAVPWWSPSFKHSPSGGSIAEYRKRASLVPPSIESYILGRLGLIEKLPIPLLDDFKTLASAFAAIEFAGTLKLGGLCEKRPSLDVLGNDRVFRAGFDILREGKEGINSTLKCLAGERR